MNRARCGIYCFTLLTVAVTSSGDTIDRGPVEVGDRPTGALSGKIVYVHGGHGYTADNTGTGAWTTQRPLLLGMVEDLGNKDQMDWFVGHLWRAGATVVPMRPVGHQPHEVVMDNTDPGVTFTGDWHDGQSGVYFGSAGATPYRFAHTSPSENAVARYRPNLPAEGVYPVYTWVTSGANRSANQRYRIRHSGGATIVTVDHRRVGRGPVYLGSYHFEQGDSGCVEISNASAEPDAVVIADMIRFGNGRGDIDRGGGISGLLREDEAGLYWIMWHVNHSQGIPEWHYRATDVDRSATVSASPRYATYMNNQRQGRPTGRVLVSFHSNAGSGAARGVLGLFNGNNYATSRTPHQLLLAETLAREVNDDLITIDDAFEHDWFDRGEDVTLDRPDIEFGELNNKYIAGEFDATIIETGFHDNQQDAQMLRDARVRDAIARASCQGLIKYFHAIDGGATPLLTPPPPVTAVSAKAAANGAVTLRWKPAPKGPAVGDDPSGYVVYTSTDGKGFDSGRYVAGGGTTTHTVAGLEAASLCYFRVAAANRAGQSAPSEVLACKPQLGEKKVLIVNGYDRIDRRLNPTEPYRGGGEVERVRPDEANTRHHTRPLAEALLAAAPHLSIESASNESVAQGDTNLPDYDAVYWILGAESSHDRTFDQQEQAVVRNYLAAGGRLFVSGSEIAWDLDRLDHGKSFCRDVLRLRYVDDDSGIHETSGANESVFAGMQVTFSNSRKGYIGGSPDVIEPTAGASAALTYDGGDAVAAIQFSDGNQRVIVIAAPFETIEGRAARQSMVARTVDFFGL